jgi:hypothetical protein
MLSVPSEEAKKIKEIVANFLWAVHGHGCCKIDFDEMKKEQDKISIHGSYQIKSRLARSRSITFKMELDNENHLISYVREKVM